MSFLEYSTVYSAFYRRILTKQYFCTTVTFLCSTPNRYSGIRIPCRLWSCFWEPHVCLDQFWFFVVVHTYCIPAHSPSCLSPNSISYEKKGGFSACPAAIATYVAGQSACWLAVWLPSCICLAAQLPSRPAGYSFPAPSCLASQLLRYSAA